MTDNKDITEHYTIYYKFCIPSFTLSAAYDRYLNLSTENTLFEKDSTEVSVVKLNSKYFHDESNSVVIKKSSKGSATFDEIKKLSKLDHVNIVKFLYLFSHAHYIYLVFEDLGGGDLYHALIDNVHSFNLHLDCRHVADNYLIEIIENDLCQSSSSFVVWYPFSVFSQICQGVHYLHETAQIAHLDIKPENVCFNHVFNLVKIIDFGSSISYQDTPLCPDNSPIYTTSQYESPMLRNSESDSDLSFNDLILCDYYSLGATFYSLILQKVYQENAEYSLNSIKMAEYGDSLETDYSNIQSLFDKVITPFVSGEHNVSMLDCIHFLESFPKHNRGFILSSPSLHKMKSTISLQSEEPFASDEENISDDDPSTSSLAAKYNTTFIRSNICQFGKRASELRRIVTILCINHIITVSVWILIDNIYLLGVLSRLITAFNKIDKERVGSISLEQFNNFMCIPHDDSQLFNAIDIDSNDKIEITEFIAASIHRSDIPVSILRNCFEFLDDDEEGSICLGDVLDRLLVKDNDVMASLEANGEELVISRGGTRNSFRVSGTLVSTPPSGTADVVPTDTDYSVVRRLTGLNEVSNNNNSINDDNDLSVDLKSFVKWMRSDGFSYEDDIYILRRSILGESADLIQHVESLDTTDNMIQSSHDGKSLMLPILNRRKLS